MRAAGQSAEARPGGARDWVIAHRMYGLLLRGPGMASPAAVVGHLTAVQAQDHPNARWSVAQRLAGPPGATSVDAAFADGGFLRTHVLRPTWHYVAATDLRWLMSLSGPRVDAACARQYRALELDARTLGRSNELIEQSVASGPRTRRELTEMLDAKGLSTDGLRSTCILMHAELTGVVCSGPMRAKQHTYAAFGQRTQTGPVLDGDEALGELAWRYFSTRGPATVRDFSWWSGLNARDAGLGVEVARPRLVTREIEGRTYWFAERAQPRTTNPRVDLVQCYDEMIISYGQSRDLLPTPYMKSPLLSRVDGFYHVLLLDGRALGHWRATSGRSDVDIRTGKVLDDGESAALEAAVDRYRQFTS